MEALRLILVHCNIQICDSHLIFLVPIPTTPPPIQPFPRPEILVNCLADGVNVQLDIEDKNFHGIMYVKGHAHNPVCRRTVDPVDTAELIDFTVKFDTCGLFHYNVSSWQLIYI